MITIKAAIMLTIALFILLIDHFTQIRQHKQQNHPPIHNNTDKENNHQTIE